MNFFIRQNSNEPSLKMSFINDGKNDLSDFFDELPNYSITFDMFDVNGNPVIMDGECFITETKHRVNFTPTGYVIVYEFKSSDTSVKGVFEGKINIFMGGEKRMILPLAEKLYINVI